MRSLLLFLIGIPIPLVTTQTGMSHEQAATRIDRLPGDIQAKTRLAAEVARKFAS